MGRDGRGDVRHQAGLWPLRPRVEAREGGGGGKYSPVLRSGGDSSTGEGSSSCREKRSSRGSEALVGLDMFE